MNTQELQAALDSFNTLIDHAEDCETYYRFPVNKMLGYVAITTPRVETIRQLLEAELKKVSG